MEFEEGSEHTITTVLKIIGDVQRRHVGMAVRHPGVGVQVREAGAGSGYDSTSEDPAQHRENLVSTRPLTTTYQTLHKTGTDTPLNTVHEKSPTDILQR
jgi:hypothetical protein